MSKRGIRDAEMTRRRRLFVLLKREAHLGKQIASARAAGVPRPMWFEAEVSALRWALEEIGLLYPEAAAGARGDFHREQERQRERAASREMSHGD
jgi:hypothetical protein